MKIFTSIVERYYSTEDRRTEDQLKKDFGEFPPSPLICSNLPHEFSIARVRGIGRLYDDAKIVHRLFSAKDLSDFNEFHVGLGREFLSAKNTAASTDEGNVRNGSGPSRRVIKYLMVPVLGVAAMYLLIRIWLARSRMEGHFTQMFANEKQITIMTGRGIDKDMQEVTISHEHLHYLQLVANRMRLKQIDPAVPLLSDKYKTDWYIVYLLSNLEMEARLHEMVISYYRSRNALPSTIDEFVDMLAGSKKLSKIVIDTMRHNGRTMNLDVLRYSERCVSTSREIKISLMAIKDFELRYRYITEVMTVMYGNLLGYYGDGNASTEFHMQVSRPNLYDALYIN